MTERNWLSCNPVGPDTKQISCAELNELTL